MVKFKKGNIHWSKTGIYSEETRKKMSLAKKGRKLSEETRKKMRGRIPWNKGIPASEETRMKVSLANKGKSAWNKGIKTGKPSWNKGISMREESRLKMAKAVKTVWANPGLREKQSESHKGRHLSLKTEFKKGFIPWIKGKHHSEETRKKLNAFRNTLKYREEAKERIMKQFESGDFPKVENTKPERLVKAELIKRGYKEGIDFIHQYRCLNKFMCDFGFPKQKIVVEVNGDYWHCNPKLYSKPKNQHQIRGIRRDKSKEAYITTVENHSWTYLVLWESDIQKDVAKCVNRIEEVLAEKKTNL